MDEEMSDEPIAIEKDLSCPVCYYIYRDPMLLPCTHSVCGECCQKLSNKCPICREPFTENQPTYNRALDHACDSYRRDKNLWPSHAAPVPRDRCRLHGLEFQLYCVKDEEPVCVDCVTMHPNHELLPISQGVPYCMEQLSIKITICESKVETLKKLKKNFRNTIDFIKHQGSQAEKQIKAEFERLRTVLVAEEACRLNALSDEEHSKVSAIIQLIETVEKDMGSLTKLTQSLKKEMGEEELKFLQNFSELNRSAHWPHEDPVLPQDALLDMSKHVGSLGFNIWKNMQAHVLYYPVVLDPNTSSAWLSLSSNLTSMRESAERQVVPGNPERFDPCVFALGAEGFSSGRHRWDVVVGDSPKWVLGVCKESVLRKRKFTVSTARGVWAIALSRGKYTALTLQRAELEVETRPERVRVRLDLERGQVSFWDAGTSKHLCTLTHDFTERMFPLFGPGLHSTPMELAPAKAVVHTS